MTVHLPRTTRAAPWRVLLLLPGMMLTSASSLWAQRPLAYTWVEESCLDSYNCRLRYAPINLRSPYVLAVDHQPNGDHYRVTVERSAVTVHRVANGQASLLGNSRGYRSRRSTDEVTLILKRRPGTLTVVQGPNVLMSLDLGRFPAGALGYGLGTSQKPPDIRYQPVDEITFADDFMREAAGGGGTWEAVSGRWQMNSIKKLAGDAKADMSSNPFCVLSKSEDPALLVAGSWFWDEYEVSAAVRPVGYGWIGLCAYYRDERNHVLFRWRADADKRRDAAQLVLVYDGRQRVLAESDGGYEPRQWYHLALKVTDSSLCGCLDGKEVVRAPNGHFGGGLVGLYTAELPLTYFDDVKVRTCQDSWDDFTRPGGRRWQIAAGEWRCEHDQLLSESAAPQHPSAIVTGEDRWQDYTASVAVTPGADGPVGLLANWVDPQNYVALKIAQTPDAGASCMAVLSAVTEGRESVLRRVSFPGAATGTHRLTLTAEGGYLAGRWDGVRVVEALDFRHRAGKVGLLHEQPNQVVFDDLFVRFAVPPEFVAPPPIAERMVNDREMVDWASPQGTWRPPARGVRWHRGTFFDDACLTLPLTQARAARLTVILAGRESAPTEGYHVAFDGLGGCTLSRGGTQLGSGQLSDDGGSLQVARRGSAIMVTVDGKVPVLTHLADTVPAGHLLGLRRSPGGAELDYSALRVSSRKMIDYVFTRAPVDWHVQRGRWGTWNRWNCNKQWSFFGAPKDFEDCVPTIWTKRAYKGDVVFEMYAGLPMDTTPRHRGYTDPSNINCTLFGDGRNLNSGYSFIYAGWHNTKSALFRGDKQVGESFSHHFVNPISSNSAFHHHWFYVRAERIGGHVRFFVDDGMVAEYDDPAAFDAGRIALWTFNNGLMVARARLSYREESAAEAFPAPAVYPQVRPSVSPSRAGVYCTFEKGFGTFSVKDLTDPGILSLDSKTRARGQKSLRISTPTSGGALCCNAATGRMDLRKMPHLSFDYRFDPGVTVNLYFTANRQHHAVILTGEDQPESVARVIGRLPNFRADGKWHRAEFDVLGAFQKLYGEGHTPVVTAVTFASPARTYVRCGFGGNQWGTSYNLDNFQLGAYPKGRGRAGS